MLTIEIEYTQLTSTHMDKWISTIYKGTKEDDDDEEEETTYTHTHGDRERPNPYIHRKIDRFEIVYSDARTEIK